MGIRGLMAEKRVPPFSVIAEWQRDNGRSRVRGRCQKRDETTLSDCWQGVGDVKNHVPTRLVLYSLPSDRPYALLHFAAFCLVSL